VGIFESPERAQAALARLRSSGFDTSKLSVIGKEEPSEAHQLGLAVVGEQRRAWGRRSELWNQVERSPAAMALAWVPFIGHIVAVGPVAAALAGRQFWAAVNARGTALERMLTLCGMSSGEVHGHEAAVRRGQILLLLHGGEKDTARARVLLHVRGAIVGRPTTRHGP
jgi:hypothetical protein